MKNVRYRVTYINNDHDEYHFYSTSKRRAVDHAQQFIGRSGEVTVSVIKEHNILQTLHYKHEQRNHKPTNNH